MVRRPTLYLNENISVHLVKALKKLKIKAIHTYFVGNGGIPDENQLEYAAKNKYILVTHNRADFKKLHKEWVENRRNHSGILAMKPNEEDYLAKRIQSFFLTKYHLVAAPFYDVPPAIDVNKKP